MTTYARDYQLDRELTLADSEQSPLTVQAQTLTLTIQNDTLIESRFTFHVNPELYQRIHTKGLFNLQPELRGSLTNGEFDHETNIEIIVSLKPNLLPNFTSHLDNPSAYLEQLSQADPNHPLLSTESWLGLQVNQQRLPITTGYSTFWKYINLRGFNEENINSTQISNAIFEFFQDWAKTNLEPLANDSISQAFSEVTQEMETWIDSSISAITSETLMLAVAEMTDIWENLVIPNEFDISQQNIANPNIFAAVVNFFATDDWPYTKIQGKPELQMAFSGKNGVCSCYAKVKEREQQFVFYSICPIIAPESKRPAIAEFIARGNHDMIIGNFELDFNSGEIRYKTSINVENNQLSFSSIQILVYTNVKMMDKYIPGIISIINDNVSPVSAIQQIEIAVDISESLNQSASSLVITSSDAREQHILSILTPEEIDKFYQKSQMIAPYQQKKVAEITEKLQTEIITRLGDLGVEIFTRASTFFLEFKLAAKNFKLIQRYSGIAGKIRLLLQHFHDLSQENDELSINSDIRTAVIDLDNLFWRVNERLKELPTEKFEGRKEVELLLEIEEIREKLSFYNKKI